MPEPYPPEFRRRALDLVASGRTVREVAASLGSPNRAQWIFAAGDTFRDFIEVAGTDPVNSRLAAAPERSRHGREPNRPS